VIKLLYLVASLDYSGAAQKVRLLARDLPCDKFEVRVAVLGTSNPWVERLRAVGLHVDVLGWKRTIDLRPLLGLRSVFRSFQPQVVHAWSREAIRSLAVAGMGRRVRLLISDLLKPGHPLGFLDRFLVRRAATVVAFSAAEAERYRRNGIPKDQIATVPPGIDTKHEQNGQPPVTAPLPSGRFVLGIGPLEMHKGFRDAVWALDILHYLYSDLSLVLAGNGSDRLRIAQFAEAVGTSERVHFLGPVADLWPLLHRAAAVWVPSRVQGGVGAALEAMAAGRPVVATRTAELDEIIVDGVTGFLVRPGDKAGLARQTRLLLDDPSLADRLGEAARRHVLEHFPAARMVEACDGLYSVAQPAHNPGVTS